MCIGVLEVGFPMIERLKKEMLRNGINARELADRAGVGRSFVYDILSGKSRNPTTKKMSAVADILGVTVAYLLNGLSYNTDIDSQGTYVAVPEIDVVCESSDGTEKNVVRCVGQYHYFLERWVYSDLKAFPGNLRAAFVKGDGMEPTLYEQDMVVVDNSQNCPSPTGIFLLFDGKSLKAKRLEFIQSCPDMIKIISDNKSYESYESPLAALNIVGKILWYSRKI